MKKKPKIQLALLPNPELEQSIENLADAVVENLKGEHHSEYEPFEAYANKVRMHIYDNIHEFRHRFVRGYEVLLEEVGRESEKESDNNHIKP